MRIWQFTAIHSRILHDVECSDSEDEAANGNSKPDLEPSRFAFMARFRLRLLIARNGRHILKA